MDRQDIDALLIGALYGELAPADEARLAAHLDSHPADKTALDDLKSAREQVKRSRIFEPQLQTDPPQAISAVLLQEAARRAPKQVAAGERSHDSWFQRFVRSFASHPAMAAAAMLVLVVGIAGTIYMRNGNVGVEPTADQEVATQNAPVLAPPTTPAPTDQSANGKDLASAGSAAYQVGLAEGQTDRKQAEQPEADNAERAKVAQVPATETTTAKAADYEKKPAAHASKKGTGYLEVDTPRAPKEMPDPNAVADKDGDDDGIAQKQAGPSNKFATAPAGNAAPGAAPSTGGAAGGGAAPQQPSPAPQVAATAPPPPPADYTKSKAAVAKPAPAQPSKTVAKAAPKPEAAPVEATRGDSDLIAWAKQQHAAAVAKVKAGDCNAAATLSVTVRSRAYGYYQQNMANDRELKGCASYIANAVAREEERTSKPKAAKSLDEAPAATRSK